MKTAKCLLPLLVFLLAITGLGCTHSEKTRAEKVITKELDLLKELDSETVQKYLSYQVLFPDTAENEALSEEINEVFSLFFQDFNYKILNIDVDKEKNTAQAAIRLYTLDARSLAEDFARTQLEKEILAAADDHSQNTKDTENDLQDDSLTASSSHAAASAADSLQERFLTLNRLLNEKKYQTVERNCTIELQHPGNGERTWEIIRTDSLENDLVGGLMTYLSNSDTLTPEETLTVYLNTLKKMDETQMSNYLGTASIQNGSDPFKNAIASALTEQVHNDFNYEIMDSDISGYTAVVETKITTFDSDAILSTYRDTMEEYLSSPSAVIDGSQKRYEYSYARLLECIQENTATRTAKVDFTLINDGRGWKLQDNAEVLGTAIFGTLATSPVEEDES